MSKRQEERIKRQRAFWAAKRARCGNDPHAKIAVRFDELRAVISELPKGVQLTWIRSTDETLRELIDQVRKSKPTDKPPTPAAAGAIRKP